MGRWNSVDPLADVAPAWSPYRYGFNNPIVYTDPDGLIESKREPRERNRKRSVFEMIEEVWNATADDGMTTVTFSSDQTADDCCPYGDPPVIEAKNAQAVGMFLDEYRKTVNLPSQVTDEQLMEASLWVGTGFVTGLAGNQVKR